VRLARTIRAHRAGILGRATQLRLAPALLIALVYPLLSGIVIDAPR
jgi:hypothetical protein